MPALAADPSEQLVDPAQEARARALSEELRCLVCQNQSIEASNAQLAKDLRLLVRERITAGDSDDAIKTFLVERYGEFVLLKPRFSAQTAILWGAPFAVLAIGAVAAFRLMRRRGGRPAVEAPLSEAEKTALAEIVGRDEAPRA